MRLDLGNLFNEPGDIARTLVYLDPGVFDLEDLIFYLGDWKREDALKALAADDRGFVLLGSAKGFRHGNWAVQASLV